MRNVGLRTARPRLLSYLACLLGFGLLTSAISVWAQPQRERTALQVPTGTAPATVEPTVTAAPTQCGWNWNDRYADDLSAQLQATVEALQHSGVQLSASAHGEDSICGPSNKVMGFSAMETDFSVKITVDNLGDLEAMGNTLRAVLTVINASPRETWPASTFGQITVYFIAAVGKQEQYLLISPEAFKTVMSQQLAGAALLKALGSDAWPPLTTDPSRATFEGPGANLDSVAFSPDGKLVALAAGYDGIITIWDVASGQKRTIPKQDNGQPRLITFSADGKLLASVDSPGAVTRVTLWEVASGQKKATLCGAADSPSCGGPVAFSLDGKLLAAMGRDHSTVSLWELATGHRQIIRLSLGDVAVSYVAALNRDGSLLAVEQSGESVEVVDLKTGQRRAILKQHSEDFINSLAFSPDSQLLAAATADGQVQQWDVPSGQLTTLLPPGSGAVHSVAYSPNGKLLASAGANGLIRLWNIPNGTRYATIRAHTDAIQSVVFSPDSKLLASAGIDGLVKLWDVPGTKP